MKLFQIHCTYTNNHVRNHLSLPNKSRNYAKEPHIISTTSSQYFSRLYTTKTSFNKSTNS